MGRLRFLYVWSLVMGMVCMGCAADDYRPGQKAQIPQSARQITFYGGSEGPVVFDHDRHANETFNGACLNCHDHEAISGDTHWSCRDCHAAGSDLENLCDEVDADHGCIMTQCQSCHTKEGPPAPDGGSCGLANGGCHS